MSSDSAAPGPRITALAVPEVAAILSRSGSKHVTEATIRADIAAGAPVNGDGTVNLVQYAAWLVRRDQVAG